MDPFFNPDDIDDIDDTQSSDPQSSLSSSSETYLVGFIVVNIVGLQYYPGIISGREMVGFVREPFNTHDENAIKVLNTRGVQVGHVERLAAKVLAPLIDSQFIFVEGIVPNTPKNARFKLPCQVHVFARPEAFAVVKGSISEGGLQLVLYGSPSFALSDSVAVKEKKNSKGVKSVDDIFKNVGKIGSSVDSLDPPKDVIVSELFAHQKYGLGWMVARENSVELPPFWEEKDHMYVNVLTNFQSTTRPEPLNGGIFADDMGLGKTLTLLSLIAYDKTFYGDVDRMEESVDYGRDGVGDRVDDSWGTKPKRGRKGKRTSASTSMSGKKRKVDGNEVSLVGSKTTLVVCPPSVFSTWVTQLCEHTKRGSLNMYMHYGAERTKDVEEFKKYDIILTTYHILAHEFHQGSTPLKKMEWWRIILDEGHMIKNPEAGQSRAVRELNSKRRWVVTGTPIQNSSCDLFSLMAFLRFDPFSNKSYWNSLIQRPLAQNDDKGLDRLQVLMATVSLRRTKEQNLIGLPSKTIQICHVDLLDEERELYDRMEVEAKNVVRNYITDDSVTRNYSTILSVLLRLRQICTDVALCPHDIKSLLPADNIGDVSNNPELLEKMLAMLQDGEDFDCPICISPPTDVVITRCAHLFCRGCITKTLKRTKPNCPMCRHPLSGSDLYSAPPPSDSSSSSDISPRASSSKVSVLLKLLSESKNHEGGMKSVVFSQFRKMLILLEGPLKAAGFKTLRLDGTMNAKRRAQVIQEFSVNEPNSPPTVLLASLKACGTGINLTAASVVYLLEPWWNPATEEQAMDRVHRIGQKRDVKVVRIIARNTIEERVLELQEKKRELARGAFGGKQKKVNVNELCTLMSL